MIFPIDNIIFLNITIIVVLLLFLWSGYKRGFLMKVLDCFSTIVLAVFTWFISDKLSTFIKLIPQDVVNFPQPEITNSVYNSMNRICVFALLFFCLWLVVMAVKPLFKTISSLPILHGINKLLGVLFGALQAMIVLIIIVFIMQTPLFANGDYVIKHSYLESIATTKENVLNKLGSASQDMQALQKVVTPNSDVTQEDAKRIREWLENNGVGEATIEAFFEEVIGI